MNEIKKENDDKEIKNPLTIGIITPFRDQCDLLIEKFIQTKNSNYFFNELKLKIMTFDGCQGEERDIIFYSLVENKKNNSKFRDIFRGPSEYEEKNLPKINKKNSEHEESSISECDRKLNVGFSRAKECIHFILSKEYNEYTGRISDLLKHYHNILAVEDYKKDQKVDSKSPMERKIHDWFYETNFWKTRNKKNNIEFKTQEKIKGENYKENVVDFLLTGKYNEQDYKIIIEYDGFFEHFSHLAHYNNDELKIKLKRQVDIFYSLTCEDRERQVNLQESGYSFIRLNKFNINKVENEPVECINDEIMSCLTNIS